MLLPWTRFTRRCWKQLPTMAKVDPPNTELICCLCIFPLNYDVHESSLNIQISHSPHRTKVKKYTLETAYKWCGIFTKWQHHAESPGADISHLSTKEIRGRHWASAVPVVAPWGPGPSVLLAAQQACLAKPRWNSPPSSAIHRSLWYLHGPH